MSHLVITLCVLVGYVVLTAMGVADETLKSLLLLAGGFWFGVMGSQKLLSGKKPNELPGSSADPEAKEDKQP